MTDKLNEYLTYIQEIVNKNITGEIHKLKNNKYFIYIPSKNWIYVIDDINNLKQLNKEIVVYFDITLKTIKSKPIDIFTLTSGGTTFENYMADIKGSKILKDNSKLVFKNKQKIKMSFLLAVSVFLNVKYKGILKRTK